MSLDVTRHQLEVVQMCKPFDGSTIDQIDRWSKSVLVSRARSTEEKALAAFFAKRNVTVHKKDSCSPVGYVVHYAPKNVDTTFAYVLLVSILCGNSNAVRLTSDGVIRERQESLINEINSYVGTQTEIAPKEENYSLNAKLASNCDVRVIWGGDASVNEIRKAQLQPWAREITFRDRRSIALLNADLFLKTPGTHKKIANDVLWMQQASCTSTRGVAWLGEDKTVKEAIEVFVSLFGQLEFGAIERFVVVQSQAIERRKILGRFDSIVNVVCSKDEFAAQVQGCTAPGVVIHSHVDDLGLIKRFKDRSLQTVVELLTEKQRLELQEMIIAERVCDRVVCPGRSMEFGWIWDGYDLVSHLTHTIGSNVGIESFFDDPRSRESEELASHADRALRAGRLDEAKKHYSEAARLEEANALDVPGNVPRVRSVLAISAVSLWLKAGKCEEAYRAASLFLVNPDILTFEGRTELRTLITRVRE